MFEKGLEGVEIQYRDANKWFESAAKGGLPNAQFEMGKNMVLGLGCEQDHAGGMKWIKAAVGGHPSAQLVFADEIERQRRSDERNLALLSWLRNAASGEFFPAKVELAWALSTTSTPALHDPDEALALLNKYPDSQYKDSLTLMVNYVVDREK